MEMVSYFFSLFFGAVLSLPACISIITECNIHLTEKYMTRVMLGITLLISCCIYYLLLGIEPWMAIQLSTAIGLLASYSKKEVKDEAVKQFRLEVAHGYRKDIPIPAAMQFYMVSDNTLPVVIQPHVYEVAPVVLAEARA